MRPITVLPPKNKRVTALYTYEDERGQPLFQIVREEPKGFYAQRRDGGKWTRGLGDTRRVLYRLPAVLRAIIEARPVWIVEGEKDADKLASLGLTATTSPFGAGNWKPEYTEGLRGARVVIVPDHDEPGRRHAQHIAAGLEGVAECWILELPAIQAGQDISNWLDRHTLTELAPLVKAGLLPENAISVPQELEPKSNSLTPSVGRALPATLITCTPLITCSSDWGTRQVLGVSPVWGMDEPLSAAANTDGAGVLFLEAVDRPEGVPLGKRFRCILPNHEDDNPSAQIYRDEKFLRYRCFAGRHKKNGWPLAQVWAYVRTRQEAVLEQRWKVGLLLAWQARMLLELGLQPWPDLGLTDLPREAPASARAVWAGFKTRLACGRLHDLTNMCAQPFGKDFASAWCGISRDEARNGLRWLVKHTWLNNIGQMPVGHHRVNVYATGHASGADVTWWTKNLNPGVVLHIVRPPG